MSSYGSVGDSEKAAGADIEEALGKAGFTGRHVFLLLTMAVAILADQMELEVGMLLGPELLCLWDLSALHEAMLTSSVYLGMCLGGVLWGSVSDRWGRKPTILAINLLGGSFALLSSYAPGPVTYFMCRMGAGFAIGGFHVCYTYAIEFVSTQYRARACFLLFIAHFLGLFLGSLLAVFTIPNPEFGWRGYLFFTSLPCFLVFIVVLLTCPESPRYLLVSGNKEKALEVIKSLNTEAYEKTVLAEAEVHSRGSIRELLTPTARLIMIAGVSISWMLMRFQNLGITLLFFEDLQNPGAQRCDIFVRTNSAYEKSCSKLVTEDYIMNTIFSSSFLVASFISVFLADFIGRRKALLLLTLTSSTLMAVLLLCMSINGLTAVAIFVKSFAMASVMVITLYVNEIFPTYIRSLASGVGDCVSRLGLIASPFVAQFVSKSSYPLAVSIYLVCGYLMAALLALTIEETRDQRQVDSDKT